MNQKERIRQIERVQKTTEPITKKKIWYDGEEKWREVYSIPLRYLMYNPHNGRIMSAIKTFEKQFHQIDLSSDNDKLLIERFLWDSAPDYNKHSLESLDKYGQNEIGIVTKDGIIIDGNRRALLLNYLNDKDSGSREFLAVVLPDVLEGNSKQLNALETIYQIGVDDKVDYNPIEKYLKAKELSQYFSVVEIAEMMAEGEATIKSYIEILQLMEEYLKQYDLEGIYSRLEKREGHFVDLAKYLNTYNKSYRNQNVDWQYQIADVEKLKRAYFDYVRLGIPVAACRIIGRSKNSFFSIGSVWKYFIENHEQTFSGTKELSVSEFKKKYGGSDINKIIQDRENLWQKEFESKLLENLSLSTGLFQDLKTTKAPIEQLKRVLSILELIDIESIDLSLAPEAKQLINRIRRKIDSFEKSISK